MHQNRSAYLRPRRIPEIQTGLLIAVLAFSSVLIQGYHFGYEDGAIYISSIKKELDASLYPYDAMFFLSQTRWMLADKLLAASVRLSRLPLDVVVFLWHLLAIFLVLEACRRLARRCFAQPAAQWAAVSAVWAARLLPVAGTQLNLTDTYFHPRDLSTAAILFAFVAVLEHRLISLGWLALAAVLHPTVALFGAFHLAFQRPGLLSVKRQAPLAAAPVLAVGVIPNQAWREVIATRPYLFPLRWHWYEWLGVFAPLLLLAWFARLTARSPQEQRGVRPVVTHVCRRVVLSGSVGVAGAILVTTVPRLEGLIPLEPMRTLHFVYLMMVFLGGGLIGEFLLGASKLRWLAFLLPICAIFYFADRVRCEASPHVEWPGRTPANAWVEAFGWIRRNTPRDALFALDPKHMWSPGEDSHGFRAFAERSMLADGVKDRAVAALEPALAPAWREQVRARKRWREFTRQDFLQLKKEFGVRWVVLELPSKAQLPCPYRNGRVTVCQVE